MFGLVSFITTCVTGDGPLMATRFQCVICLIAVVAPCLICVVLVACVSRCGVIWRMRCRIPLSVWSCYLSSLWLGDLTDGLGPECVGKVFTGITLIVIVAAFRNGCLNIFTFAVFGPSVSASIIHILAVVWQPLAEVCFRVHTQFY